MNKKQELITKDMLISDLIKKHPLLIEALQDNGIQFIGKHIASNETIEQAAMEQNANMFNIIDDIHNSLRYQK
jgi:hypothetical protein